MALTNEIRCCLFPYPIDIAEAVNGWPLHIIEEARNDPKLERPEAFALYAKL